MFIGSNSFFHLAYFSHSKVALCDMLAGIEASFFRMDGRTDRLMWKLKLLFRQARLTQNAYYPTALLIIHFLACITLFSINSK